MISTAKPPSMLRRALLKYAGLALSGIGGMTASLRAWAAQWNKPAFDALTLTDAMRLFGSPQAPESKDIIINAPEIAENGAVVPFEVISNLPNTQSMTLYADKNPQPLIGSFEFANSADGYVSTRIKLAETTRVRVVVKADGKFYQAAREIKVTIGGCG